MWIIHWALTRTTDLIPSALFGTITTASMVIDSVLTPIISQVKRNEGNLAHNNRSTRISIRMELKKREVQAANVPSRINSILSKYGVIDESLLKETTAQVELESIYVDVEYVGTIGVGTPPKNFDMVLDTGSSDIWFPSSACKTCGSHPLYNSYSSSSYTPLFRTWSLSYFDGSYVGGMVGKDTLHIGDLSHANQTIGVATLESPSFARNEYMDGIFGLGFPSLSLTRQRNSIIMDMFYNMEIDEPVVGIYLGRTQDGGKGEATFGGINKEHFDGELQYIDVTEKKYWKVDFDGIDIDGTLHRDFRTNQAMVDTGTTLTILPTSLVDAIHDTIPDGRFVSSVGWFFPCQSESNSTITFKLGGKDFAVPVTTLIRDRYLPEDPSYCITGLGASDSGLVILGETFLRNFYSVYDYNKAKVGLAPSKQ
ncbi:aspartic peptidase domain-containing protein [Chlamydoabsidia padenii]|nr:aspartic peptidase domain-containing protein [Chlamydoabsidia padenii]